MNWYKHYMGDFARDTAHLTILQHGVYRLLLDHYYATEKPLINNTESLCRVIRACSKEEKEAVQFILNEFFILENDVFHNTRADKELSKYEAQASTNRRIARERTVPRTVDEPLNDPVTYPDTRYQIPDNQIPKPEKANGDKPPRSRFIQPSLKEVTQYCEEIESSVNPVAFWNHYEAIGWKVGKNGMKNWKAAIRSWTSREGK